MTDHDDIDDGPVDGDEADAADAAELTIDADPVWLDQIRASAGDAPADPELTIDASPELVDVIRSEIARRDAMAGGDATPPDDPIAPPSPPTSPASPPTPPLPPTSPAPPTAPAPSPAQPLRPTTPGPAGRWQPQERLANRAPVTAMTPFVRTEHRHRTKDSTKVILAAIAATAIVAVAWLLVGGETAVAPPSLDTSTTVGASQPSADSTTPVSTPP